MKRHNTIRLASASTMEVSPHPISATECARSPATSPSTLSRPSHPSVTRDNSRARRASRNQAAERAGCESAKGDSDGVETARGETAGRAQVSWTVTVTPDRRQRHVLYRLLSVMAWASAD
ncbi:hypothetical protein Ssi02_17220 [Sinosporangium siamense]|uniref:Uncharacterized protein n=1 Tax=Sinosporangium siamense TaxID=1367973 RepID=A0A919RCN1_9ACTN|nr:hypothetical protein Ssi02_17220 [Sinosporangium siamense]